MIAEQKKCLVRVMQGTRIFVVMTCCCVLGYYCLVFFSFFDRWQTMQQTTLDGSGKREAEGYNYESSISLCKIHIANS